MRTLTVAAAIAVPAVILVRLFHAPLDPVSEQMTTLETRLRGTRQVDTNVVVVYIDDEAIRSLGYPVRRNFYALMVKALSELKVKAIGIEPVFEDPKPEYPEYDELLSSVVASTPGTVLTSYFDATADAPGPEKKDVDTIVQFSYPYVNGTSLHGASIHLPFRRLLAAAGGIGHLNFTEDSDIPVFITDGKARIPAFGAELLRVYEQVDRQGVLFSDEEVRMQKAGGGGLQFSTGRSGIVRLNYPGPVSSFAAYPFLEVLKSYDALRTDRVASVPVSRFMNKVVLIGIIAEGRGSHSYKTPFDPRLPSLCMHATFLDNALHSGFLHPMSDWLSSLLCLLAGISCVVLILGLHGPADKIAALGVICFLALSSFLLFATAAYVLPLAPLLAVGVISSVVAIVFKHRYVSAEIDSLHAERENILAQLRDREAKLALVERELIEQAGPKPADRTEELLEQIRRYKAEIRSLTSRADDMEEYRGGEGGEAPVVAEFEGIVYAQSGKMKPVIEFITKIAESEAPVLILGESGTGKELVARAIHRRSTRKAGAFIAVNCGALSENLLESELFGHERGAFTGAVKDKPGRFELADGGTIFLDEIGEVTEGFQLKLLRVLQEGELERVGGTKTIKVNVRVLAATNRDLREDVRAKTFREDLYYRLNVLSVALPPLRDRQTDIPVLIRYFLEREGPGIRISKNVMEALQRYPWGGNIRELESAMKRAVLLAKAEKRPMVSVKDLNEEIASAVLASVPVEDQILDLLREKGFSRSSISESADELGGLNRGTVAEYLRGECLKAFAENVFDAEKTIHHISLSGDPGVNERVKRKLMEYLSNISEAIDPTQPWEGSRVALKPKLKNLPQRYHLYLEQVAEACYRGVWKAGEKVNGRMKSDE